MPEAEPSFPLYKDAHWLLTMWQPNDRATLTTRDGLLNMLRVQGHAAFDAATLPGHVTVSMVVVDWQVRRTLLVKHPAAGWLQPGGHVRLNDRTLQEAATHKAEHETGIRLDYVSPFPLDVDVHPIPCAGEWALHWDVRFAGKAPRDARPELPLRTPLQDVRWFHPAQLQRHGAASRAPLVRMAQWPLGDDSKRATH